MSSIDRDPSAEALAQELRRFDERLRRIEARLGLEASVPDEQPVPAPSLEERARGEAAREDALELELGQRWFAVVGVVVLALGAAFALSRPLAMLPPAGPALLGLAGAALALWLAQRWSRRFEVLSRPLRGAGLGLLFFAVLRLFFFGEQPVLARDSWAGMAVLTGAVGIGLAVALCLRSPLLAIMGLVTGWCALLVAGATGFVLPGLIVLAVVAVWSRLRYDWPVFGLVAIVGGHATYAIWMLNNPVFGRPLQWVTTPGWAVGVVLLQMGVLALGSLLRPARDQEDPWTILAALANSGAGFVLFYAHAEACWGRGVHPAQAVGAAGWLALAITFWIRERSRYSTFIYSMTGYLALSIAILKASEPPLVFVWLSLQSLLVVATAIWFRSRFIVVANFLIYLATMGGYVAVAERETGVSFVFGVVALASARLLNWQNSRLALKTEAMRNAYLFCAFAAFPYALYHLLPRADVAFAWVGVALGYYALNAGLGVRKYRWMGHATLVLTVGWVVLAGWGHLESMSRILSLLVLGLALVVVSLVFTLRRARPPPPPPPPGAAGEKPS